MRKIEFLNALERYLKALNVDKIDAILRDYEEYFIESAQMGKTEEEIVASLGNPVELAKSYANSSQNRNVKEEKQVVKYNITVVTGKCVVYTMMFVVFCIVSFILLATTKSIGGFAFMLLIDVGFLVLSILEFKKLKKYKNAQKELNDLTKKDI